MFKSKKIWITVGLILLFVSCSRVIQYFNSEDYKLANADIAVVSVEGEIIDAKEILRQLEKVKKSQVVQALVLRVDSPGGVVTPSQEIYEEIKKIAQKKKVVVSMGTLAASGGYYISCPAHKIFANPSTITGSIGVLMQHFQVGDLLSSLKIDAQILKSGSMKDAGSPLRKMQPDEKNYFEEILRNMHQQFMRAVAEGRKIPYEEVEKIADGRAYTGEQALKIKLVDQLGSYNDAIEDTAKVLGLKNEPRVVKLEKENDSVADILRGREKSKVELMFEKLISKTESAKVYYLYQ